MKKLLIFLLSIVILFSWELKKNENGIQVFTRNVENSKYDEFKAQITVNKPFEKVKKMLLNFKDYPKWQKKIENIEVKNGYMLKELDFPFPLSNRFAFYKINIKQTSKKLYVFFKSIPYDKLPEKIKNEFKKPSCVEMKDDIIFEAEKTDKGIKIVYAAKVDPKGAPAFIFNRKIVSAGYETLNNLKEKLNE